MCFHLGIMLLNNDYDVSFLTVSNLLTLPPLPPFPCSTIVYELVTLEHPFSTLPLHSLIWQVGQGATQSLTKLPKGRFKSITAQCWRENPALRPTFDDILTIRLDKKAFPRSDRSSAGTPCQQMTWSTNSWAMVNEVWSGAANTSGHLVR